MSDTVGVVYRATTGKPDPWTINEINHNHAQDILNGTRATGGSDLPPQSAEEQAVYDQALAQQAGDTEGAIASQPKNSCSVTSSDFSLGACIKSDFAMVPTWVWWVGGGLIALLILGELAPYVRLFERD
jgi:hypothetical protein